MNGILAQSSLLNLKWRLQHVSLTARCLSSKIGRITGCRGLMWRSRSLLRTVLELIGRNPVMPFAVLVRLDVWNRSRRCTGFMWLSCWRDIITLVLLDCLKRLNNDCIVFRWTTKCLATMFCDNPAWSIPITWRRWFSMRRDKTLKSMSFKQVFFLICRGQNKPSVNYKQSQIVKRGWRIKEDQNMRCTHRAWTNLCNFPATDW